MALRDALLGNLRAFGQAQLAGDQTGKEGVAELGEFAHLQ